VRANTGGSAENEQKAGNASRKQGRGNLRSKSAGDAGGTRPALLGVKRKIAGQNLEGSFTGTPRESKMGRKFWNL